MKNILTILALAASLFAASVQLQAQAIAPAPADGSGVVVYNSVATNLALGLVSIDCSKQQNVAISWTLQLNGAGTEVHGVRFIGVADPSVRPTTPTLADGFSMAIAAAGTAQVNVQTNFNVKGYSRLDCYYLTNGTAGLATNWFKYSVKANAP